MKIAHYVSNQLKGWASAWLVPLMDVLERKEPRPTAHVAGALNVMCTYLYGITLLSRPFLIYDVYDSLGTTSMKLPTTQLEERDKRKYADGAVDAAITMITMIEEVIDAGSMPSLMPGIVSWLFAGSLVLALSMLGRHGLALQERSRAAVACLQYFGKSDPHARQYATIVSALLDVAISYNNSREPQFRARLKQASSELFGLSTSTPPTRATSIEQGDTRPLDDRISTAEPAPSIRPAPVTTNPFTFPWTADDDMSLQEFLRPTGPHLGGFAVEDSFFPIDDSINTFFNDDLQ
ncbi:hypothetical protein CAC42_2375 [Sphaceloma murrayae]|uniref:Uncharacterized protein n=1 Tax=Sphaceloma murrayae TaxID=2082308 RepID=A0A2K1QVW1_9PEZI|nr:hypothetical protein CAC42_2375 [Sphaceloma murrayae]